MFSEFSFIGTLFLFGVLRWACCVGLLHSQPEALPLQPWGVSLELGLWPTFPPWDAEGAIENRVQGPQDRPCAGPSRHLCSFVLLILQFLFCVFFWFFYLFKMSCKVVQEKSSFSSFLLPSPLVLMVLIISWLGNGPPRGMGCRDPGDVHTGLWLTRLFCQNPFFTRSPTVLGSFLEITL